MKPPLRTKSVGTKVSEAEFALLTMTYDALGRQVTQVRGGANYEIIYNVNGSKLAILHSYLSLSLRLPLPGGASAVYGWSGMSYYRHPGWLGSSRVVSTPSRTLYLDSSYAPFGEGYGVSGTLDGADLSFTGFDRDVAADQWTSPTRQLAVVTGRWTSPDPAGLSAVDPTNPQSWNRYSYVLNNPLANVDPLGLHDDCGGPCSGFSYQEDGCTVIVSYYVDDIGYDEPLISTYCPAGGPVAVSSGGGGGRGGKAQQKAPKNGCFSPNWLQQKGIALQQKVAQFFGHPFGFGAGASAGVGLGKGFGFAGNASAQMIVNPDGNAFLVYTYGGSGLTTPWLSLQSKGAGVVGGFQGSVMTATNTTASDLRGYAVDGSAGGGNGLGLAGDVSYSGGFQGTLTLGGAAGGWGQAGVITKAVAIPSCSNHP